MKKFPAIFCPIAALILACAVVTHLKEMPTSLPTNSDADSGGYNELLASFPKNDNRIGSARIELKYWHENQPWARIDRQTVKTKDGRKAEVVLLSVPAMSMPGIDFSMALLLINNRVVDWASCWTHNRTANQDLQLEDVDGDGVVDVSFRASAGWHGLRDTRQHTRPGDDRRWLYAYEITEKGFQSLFPVTDRNVKVINIFDTSYQPVELKVTGLTRSVWERQMAECTISATNISKQNLAVRPAVQWFNVESREAGFMMSYPTSDAPVLLKPGESVSQVVQVLVREADTDVTLQWKFIP